MDSQILFAAEQLGVFNQLDANPMADAELAEAIRIPEDSARRLLTALCALELVQKTPDARYANAPQASERLVSGKPGYMGGMFRHLREDLYPVWQHFCHALVEGRSQWERAFPGVPASHERVHENPHALREFMGGMHAISYGPAAEFAQIASELDQVNTIVDIGGATGAFLIALARAHPRLKGIVFDLPQVQPVADDYLRESGVSDRIRFQPGDFWEDDLPAGCDAYCLGFILHDWDDLGQRLLLQKVARFCPRNGLLILGEYLLNDARTGPLWVARSDLNMLAAARGRERTAGEYREWVGQSGFDLENIYLTSGGKNFLIFRRNAKAS